jgi:hypothetical protein
MVELSQVWIVKGDLPYHNPAIIKTLKAGFFQATSSAGYRAVKEYNEAHNKGPRAILPPSLVALVATGVSANIIPQIYLLISWGNERRCVRHSVNGSLEDTRKTRALKETDILLHSKITSVSWRASSRRVQLHFTISWPSYMTL